jgi:WD40 repeat protein/tRNA A-37 threonylcarbamoyl transferase component Bud32
MTKAVGICSLGHQWQTTGGEPASCPVCGKTAEHEDRLAEALLSYQKAVEAGRRPERVEFLRRYPELAGELETLLSAGQQVGVLLSPLKEAMGSGTPTAGLSRADANGVPTALPQLPGYEVLEELGRGGMGVVFKARERELDRVVALKMILAGQLASEIDIQRFRAEAQALARLDHPGIVPVYEVGEHDGLHYFTMAFIEGTSLADRLRDGPLAPKEAARLVRDLSGAIVYAHLHGIVHRDLKPANILIDLQGQPKLTDFGLAKRTHDASDKTGAGQILGTPTYMSPEQAQGNSSGVGPASDIYGLGALLFSLLTARPPFQAATPMETMRHVLSVEPPRPSVLNPSVPRDLETICLKCLEKSPFKRYANANALKDDLDRFLEDRPILARPAGVIEKGWRWYRRRPLVGTMAAALALLLIAVPLLLAGFWQEAEARADVEAGAHQKEAAAHKKEKQAREREEEARKKIEKLERARTTQLFQAYVNEAAARRSSPRVGRRFETLERIVAARNLADELKLPSEDYVRLRSEAITALSLTDMRGTPTGPGWAFARDTRPGPTLFRYASGADCCLDWDKPSGLLVRRIGDGRIVQRIPDITKEYDWPELSSDNRFVSIWSNAKLVIWQIDGAKPQEVLRRADIQAIDFAPDRSEAILLTRQPELVIQPLNGKGEPKVLRMPEIKKVPQESQFHHLAVAGRQAAVVGATCVSIVDLDAGMVTAVCSVPGMVYRMAWSPDGATLAIVCTLDDIILYQPATKSRRVIRAPLGGATFPDFDPSGRYLLSISRYSGRGILWDVADARAELRFDTSELEAKGPARADPQLTPWLQGALDTAYKGITSLLPKEGGGYNHASAAHPGGRLVALQQNPQGIVLGDLGTGQRIGFLPVGKGSTLRFDSAGNLYGYIKNKPHCWPITTAGNRFKIGQAEQLNLPAMYSNLDICADGRFVAQAMYYNGSVLLDRQTGKTILLQPQQDVRGVAVHPNGSSVASFSFSAKGFRLWETKAGKLLHANDQGNAVVGQFTPDGKYLITSAGGIPDIQLWSVPDCKLVRKLGSYAQFAISPDSRYVAAAENAGKVRLNRIDNGELIARFDAPGEDYLADINFSPDGRYLFGMNAERTKHHVWDLWKLRRQLAELKLDWETTPAPEAAAVREPIVVEIAGREQK